MILNSRSNISLDSRFYWRLIESESFLFGSVHMIEGDFSNCQSVWTMRVDNFQSYERLIHAIEEEALMYLVNESVRGGNLEVHDVANEDLIVIGKHTNHIFVDDIYVPRTTQCWKRLFRHEGDFYEDADVVLENVLKLPVKVPIMIHVHRLDLKIGFPTSNVTVGISPEADNLDLSHLSVRKLNAVKRISTLDTLLSTLST